jgi:predicted acylesterase/phospholipase RssA
MNDFVIRNTGAVAKAWTTAVSDMKPPSLFGSKTTSTESVDQAKGAFKKYFDANVGALKSFVPAKQMEAFQAAASKQFASICERSLDTVKARDDGTIRKSDAHTAMKAANKEAAAAMKELGAKFFGKTTEQWQGEVDKASVLPGKTGGKVTTETYSTANQSLSRFLTAKFDDMRRDVPPEKRAEFDKQAESIRLQAKMTLGHGQAAVRDAGGKGSVSDYQATVRQLHTDVLGKLLELGKLTKPDITPQLVKTETGFALLRKAPALENLVLQGGGAKGVGNPPALVELAKTGVIGGLKHVVGTSAGALTAACIASGMPMTDFQKLMDTTPMTSLSDKMEGFKDIYPQVKFKDSSSGVGGFDRWAIGHAGKGKDFAAEQALHILDRETGNSVGKWLSGHQAAIDTAYNDGNGKITKDEKDRLTELMNPDFTKDRTGKMLTFRDLSILHKVDPQQFKELTLTGFNKTDRTEEYFSSSTTPDMPVALAGRISMAIPVYFQSVMHGPEGARKEYVDGGVGSNVPSEVVAKKDGTKAEKQDAQSKTMVMIFDDKGKGFSTLHGRNLETKPVTTKEVNEMGARVVRDASGADYIQTLKDDKHKVYGGGPGVHVVFHGDVDTFDLTASTARTGFAKQMGAMKTLEQILVKQNEAQSVDVTDADEAYKLLSTAERQAVVDAGPPRQEGMSSEHFQMAKALFLLCEAQVD